MGSQVNIVALVDVAGALSDGTLLRGNLSLVDDGSFESTGQGTPTLCTKVVPGQIVQWTALAVDVQTPVAIRSITFLPELPGAEPAPGPEPGDNLDLDVWSGIVPPLVPGVAYRYRLELQMYEGPYSVLRLESPALMCA